MSRPDHESRERDPAKDVAEARMLSRWEAARTRHHERAEPTAMQLALARARDEAARRREGGR